MTSAISQNGLALIKAFEGFRAEPAQLPDGNWVVGHGHIRIGDAGDAVTEAEAGDLLALDMAPVECMVNAAVRQPVTQSQFDALVSFAFSIGADAFKQSQTLRRVNAGDALAAAYAMEAWRKGEIGDKLEVIDVLVRRRAAEKAMFLQDLPNEGVPSVFLRAQLDHAAAILGAPVQYAAAPEVGSIPVAVAPPEPAQRLTEILKTEPATEALLLTQVVVDDDLLDDEASQDEIVTAHAKPVARPLDRIREVTRRAHAERMASEKRRSFTLPKLPALPKLPQFANSDAIQVDRRIRDARVRAETAQPSFWSRFNISESFENVGLIALLLFGLGLIVLGGSLFVGGEGAWIEMVGAAALVLPGMGAAFIAAVGLRRGPARA